MKAFKELYLANLRELARDRTALFFTLAFPVLFILIFGLVFSRSTRLDAKVGLAMEDQGTVAQQLATALESLPKGRPGQQQADNPFAELTFERGSRTVLEGKLKGGDLNALVIVPAGTTATVLQGRPAAVVLQVDQSQQATAPFLQGVVGDIVERTDRALTKRQPILGLDVQSVLAASLRPIDYLVPGMLAMSILNLGLFATAQPLIALRTQGVLKRLSATPLTRPTLLAAYVALRLTTAGLQAVLIVGVGALLFDVASTGSWVAFAAWILLGTLTFISIGFFVAAIARTEESGTTMINLVNLPMLFLSGIFFPIGALPGFLKPVVRAMPLTYVADALRQTMLNAPPVNAQWINLGVQAAWLVVMTGLAIRFFKWEARA